MLMIKTNICPSLVMDALHTSFTIKLITSLLLDTEPPKSPDTSMNVWCLGRISKFGSNKDISLILSNLFSCLPNAGLST